MNTVNTKEQGKFEFLVYPDEDKFIGVCLTLNIVEEAPTFEEAKKDVEEAALLHLEVVRKENLSDSLLNRAAPSEYWEKYEQLGKVMHEDVPNTDEQDVFSAPVTQYFTSYKVSSLESVMA